MNHHHDLLHRHVALFNQYGAVNGLVKQIKRIHIPQAVSV